jgi:hypothetical protein
MRTYWSDYSKNLQDKAVLQHVIDDAKAEIDRLLSLQDVEREAAETVDRAATALSSSVDFHAQQFLADMGNFQEQLKAKTDCEAIDALLFIVNVIAVAYGMYTQIVALGMDLEKFEGANKSGADAHDIVETFQPVKSDITSIQNDYNSLKKQVQDQKNPDQVKFVIEQGDYAKLLDQYGPAAAPLKQELSQLTELVNARNYQIVERSTHMLTYLKYKAEADATKAKVEQLKTTLVASDIPYLAEFTAHLCDVLDRSKERLLVDLYSVQRSISYFRAKLDYKPFSASDETAEQLGDALSTLRALYSDVRESKGKPPDQLPIAKSLLVLTKDRNPTIFKSLQKTNRAVVNILPGQAGVFSPVMRQVLVSGILVQLIGAHSTKADDITIEVTHCGNSAVQSWEDDQWTRFVHRPRTIPLFLDKQMRPLPGPDLTHNTQNNIAGEGYVPLSPFAAWSIFVDPKVNPEWTFEALHEIHIQFSGYFLERTPHAE